jgi:hypothetical protein
MMFCSPSPQALLLFGDLFGNPRDEAARRAAADAIWRLLAGAREQRQQCERRAVGGADVNHFPIVWTPYRARPLQALPHFHPQHMKIG